MPSLELNRHPDEVQLPSDPAASSALQSKLIPGERLLWAGRRNFASSLPFAALVTLAVLGVLRLRTSGEHWIHVQDILCLLVGGVFIASPVFYGLSERRLIWRSTWQRTVTSVPLTEISGIPLRITLWPSGIIGFSDQARDVRWFPRDNRPSYCLWFLGKDAPAVYEIARSAQRALQNAEDEAFIAATQSIKRPLRTDKL
jgi:hypothetical protein